jgi:hypothetical protein
VLCKFEEKEEKEMVMKNMQRKEGEEKNKINRT